MSPKARISLSIAGGILAGLAYGYTRAPAATQQREAMPILASATAFQRLGAAELALRQSMNALAAQPSTPSGDLALGKAGEALHRIRLACAELALGAPAGAPQRQCSFR